MGKQYHQLTEQDRICLRVMLKRDYSRNKIAETLGVHRLTIYRELKRNSQTHRKTDHSAINPPDCNLNKLA